MNGESETAVVLNGFREREGEGGREVESNAKGNPWMLICNWATSGTVVPRHAKLYPAIMLGNYLPFPLGLRLSAKTLLHRVCFGQ